MKIVLPESTWEVTDETTIPQAAATAVVTINAIYNAVNSDLREGFKTLLREVITNEDNLCWILKNERGEDRCI